LKKNYYLIVYTRTYCFHPHVEFDTLDDATDYAEALLKSKWAKAANELYIDLREDKIRKINVASYEAPNEIVLFDVNVTA
jgi:hypothetical protein